MTRFDKLKEFRFVVPGKAVSFRSPDAKEFKEELGKLAKEIVDDPFPDHVDVFIDYFHGNARRMDMDNISKTVLDGLNGIAYIDDIQVRRQESIAHDLRDNVHIYDGPVDLIKPLQQYEEYLFIRVREVERH